MELISIKLPAALRQKLAAEARRRNVTQSAIVRECLERALAEASAHDSPSCRGLVHDLVGGFRSGRSDLGTNKALLERAVLEGRPRATKRRH